MYDPVLGRFLAADQVVRDVGASQAWNGYGYVEGRPLTWTDPTGWASDDTPVHITPILPNEPPPTLEEVPVTAGRIFPDFNFGPQMLNFNTVGGLVQNPVQFGEGASGEGQSDGDKKDPKEEPKAEEPKPVCQQTGTPSRSNNPNVNTHVATGAAIGAAVGVAIAIVIVSSFPKAPPITPIMLAFAGEPVATYIIVSLAMGAPAAILGGAAGYATTPPMPPAPCP